MPGAHFPEAQGAACLRARLGDIGVAVVAHYPPALDALGVEPGNGPAQIADDRWRLLVRQQLDIGDASGVIHRHMHLAVARSYGAGYEKVHVAIDDATRLAYAEVLPDEKQATTVGFLIRALAGFGRQGIRCRRVVSDNGSAYRSKPWRQACEALGMSAKRTRPTLREPTARPNGSSKRWCTSGPTPELPELTGAQPLVGPLFGDL